MYIINSMVGLINKYYRLRSKWYRYNRIIFPSPAEMRFIEIMGGKVFRIEKIRHRSTKFPMTIVLSMGSVLKDECFQREVRVGKYFIDFGNDVLYGFEIDGRQWHRDVVKEFEREIYFHDRGWRVKHIDAVKLYNAPDQVQREVLAYLYK